MMTHPEIAEGLKGIRDAAIGGPHTLAVLDAAIAALEAKGKVVAEGSARKAVKTLTSPPTWYWEFFDAETPTLLRQEDWPPEDSQPAILVIRAREKRGEEMLSERTNS